MDDLRVCLLTHSWSQATGSGVDRYAWEIIKNAKGFTPIVVPEGGLTGDLYFPLRKLSHTIHVLRQDMDVIHAASPLLVDPLLLKAKKKLVVTIYDTIPFHETSSNFWMKGKPSYLYPTTSALKQAYGRFCIHLSRFAQRIIVPFKIVREDLVNVVGIAPEKIRIIHLGVDHSVFRPLHTVREDINEKRILFLGWTTYGEGFDTTLKAFSRLNHEDSSIKLVIAGKVYPERIQRLMKIYGIKKEKVRIMGFVADEELPRLYNEATVYVSLQLGGFSLSIFEAMACGTPVVASSSLDIQETVGGSVELANPCNTEEVYEALHRILTDKSHRADLSTKGLQHSMNFSWRKTAEDTLQVYKEVVA